MLPLGEGTLTKNLGIPIILVCNKTDTMSAMEKSFEYQDSDFDYIQCTMRTLALEYGAALVYTSTKNDKGTDTLAGYIAHRLLGSSFTTRASVHEKDGIFIPTGYDSRMKISVLHDPAKEGPYNEVIAPPSDEAKAARAEETVEAEDDQAFLERHKAELDKNKGDHQGRAVEAKVEKVLSSGMGQPLPAPTGPSGTPGPTASSLTPGSSAMLQSFFESLMKSESNEGLRKNVEDVIADEKKKGTPGA